MSRIGKKVVQVPSGVDVRTDAAEVKIEGPKGKLALRLRPEVAVSFDEKTRALEVRRVRETKFARAMHGTTRALLANMVRGTSQGFERILDIFGVGFTAQVKGGTLSLQVGFANAREVPIPAGLEVTVERASAEGQTVARVKIRGADKQVVGQFAAVVRRIRPPEPYKGKGIRYMNERIQRKVGKAFGSAGGSG
ncbi:MAG: 50S ribosomal protein L6 [Planctomycetes bacterium]|nr:50S ribosomal protein L6 [Planctomycetota bacterium]